MYVKHVRLGMRDEWASASVICRHPVSCSQARFSAKFNRMGFHSGFGLSHTVPRLVGPQEAALLLYTGRRIDGEEALRIRLVDRGAPTPE